MMTRTEFSSSGLGERYEMIRHSSGMDIYVYPKEMVGTYAMIATRYGSMDNSFRMKGEASFTRVPQGIAHFLEHKLFENEDGSDSFAKFSAFGADANAYTGYDRTAYVFNCTDRFRESLRELLTFVTHPYFTRETVEKERGIIAEEIRMYEDNPWEKCYRNLLCGLYHRHPVRNNICGSEASIKRITPDLLYRCYQTFYHLSNMVLVVCGSVTAQEIMEVVDEVLQAEPQACLPVEREPIREPDSICKPFLSQKMQTAKPIFNIGIKDVEMARLPKEAQIRRDAVLTLLCDVLFSRSGRFYNQLFEEGMITPSFFAGYSSLGGCGFLCAAGESDDPCGVAKRMEAYLDEVRKEGISEEIFEIRRRVMYADEIRAYDSTEEIANRLLSFVLDGVDLFSYPDLIEDLKKEELDEALRTFFDPARTVLSVIEPLEPVSNRKIN